MTALQVAHEMPIVHGKPAQLGPAKAVRRQKVAQAIEKKAPNPHAEHDGDFLPHMSRYRGRVHETHYMRENPLMENRTFHERLREKMAERGVSANALSAAVTDGGNRSYIRKMIETSSDPGIEMARKIARELGVRLAWLVGEDDRDEAPGIDEAIESVKILGEVRAGAFHEAFEAAPSDQQLIRLLPDARYPRIPRFGLRIVGHSVDLIAPNNSIVICSNFEILHEKLGRGPRHGDMVIVLRTRADLVEATCKAFVERKDGYWLEPRSTDDTIKPIFLGSLERQQSGDNEDDSVVVHSLVTSVHLEL